MLIPDVNILLNAAFRQSASHPECRAWWQGALQGSQPVGLCAPAIFGYVRLSTKSSIFSEALSVQRAFADVENWMEFPVVQWLEPDSTHLERVKGFLSEAGTGGNLVTDAQIAAYAQQYNATVCTADSDFRRFDVKYLNPLAPRRR
jgi:toxin-antitoxin system PIN domain toxin